jgi:exonuclease III
VRAVRGGAVGPWSRIRALRFVNLGPARPVVSGTSLPGAVRFNWRTTPYASRYRVRWSPAWFGMWPGPARFTTGARWLGQYARSSGYRVPATPRFGDGQLAVAYANPVFGQVRAQNIWNHTARAKSGSRWAPVWSRPPTPAAGDAVRFGTYNLMLNPTGSRATAAARNINAHGLTLVALQEAKDASATAVITTLGGAWQAVATSSNTQQIIYRSDKFTLMGSGYFKVSNARTPSKPVLTPWARFVATGANSRPFYVASVHFTQNDSRTALQRNADTGLNARQTMAALNKRNTAGNPVIVAGDLRYGREPFGDVAGSVPAHPTFVRAGYYDAMASVSMHGQNYSTYNGNSASQKAHGSGLGPRADYIVMKGVVGSSSYHNVVNWKDGSVVPSDHNLVYSDIAIPRR